MGASSILLLAGLLAGEPEFRLHLTTPVVDPMPAGAGASEGLKRSPPAELPVPYNDAVPMNPEVLAAPRPRRKLGTNTTIFVNFDGVTIGECDPSNSHKNCHWLETGETFEAVRAARGKNDDRAD